MNATELPRTLRAIDETADADLEKLARAVDRTHAGTDRANPDNVPHDAASERHVELIDAASVTPEPIRWLWPGWLARGKLHVVAGKAGTGKTTIALDVAACITSGRALPDGHRPKPGNVVIWSGEDDPADTLVPRLLAAGADLSRVRIVGNLIEDGERYPFDPARDVPTLAAALAGMDDMALLIVDPIVSAVAGDSHKNAETRRGLQPLVDLAGKVGAALLGVTHYSKGTAGRDPLERVTGSLAFGALARLVYGTVCEELDDGTHRRTLARVKSNIGPDGGGFRYAFEQTDLPDHNMPASRIVWGEAVEGSARELLAEADTDDTDRTASGECAEWLREELTTGARDAKDMQREGSRLGYTPKVIRRAREKLGIRPHREGFGPGSRVTWSLPGIVAREPNTCPPKKVGTYGTNGHVCEPDDPEPIRSRLLRLAEAEGFPVSLVHDLSADDLRETAALDMDDDSLRVYLDMLRDSAEHQADRLGGKP